MLYGLLRESLADKNYTYKKQTYSKHIIPPNYVHIIVYFTTIVKVAGKILLNIKFRKPLRKLLLTKSSNQFLNKKYLTLK